MNSDRSNQEYQRPSDVETEMEKMIGMVEFAYLHGKLSNAILGYGVNPENSIFGSIPDGVEIEDKRRPHESLGREWSSGEVLQIEKEKGLRETDTYLKDNANYLVSAPRRGGVEFSYIFRNKPIADQRGDAVPGELRFFTTIENAAKILDIVYDNPDALEMMTSQMFPLVFAPESQRGYQIPRFLPSNLKVLDHSTDHSHPYEYFTRVGYESSLSFEEPSSRSTKYLDTPADYVYAAETSGDRKYYRNFLRNTYVQKTTPDGHIYEVFESQNEVKEEVDQESVLTLGLENIAEPME